MRTTTRALTIVLLIPLLVSSRASASPPPTLTFSAPAMDPVLLPTVVGGSVEEGDDDDAVLAFTINFDQPCDDDSLSILYDVVAGPQPTATAGVDFEAADNEVVVMSIGDTSVDVTVPVHGDHVPEDDEQVTLAIIDADGCDIVDDVTGIGTILDDDVQLVSVDDLEVSEGDDGTADATFHVCLEEPALTDYSLSVGFGPGTVTHGVDVDDVDLPSLFFLVGEQCEEIAIPVHGDTEVEADETLSVSLYDDSFGLDIAKSLGTLTILDDDHEPQTGEPPLDPDYDDGSDGGDDGSPEGELEPDVDAASGDRSALPRTGATVAGLSALGLALLAAGRLLTLAVRRLR
jgi:hypothetical protein